MGTPGTGTLAAARHDDDEPSAASQENDAASRPGWVLALALLPVAVSAVALLTAVGGDYIPTGDHAGTELAVRAVGRHEILTGLYSRDDWSHPGPLSFYLLAPFYWITGGSSVGLNLGALAINGASIAGMALVALRRGGRPLMLCTLVACALVVRTLGADVVHDFQNIFIVTLPFGLMVFLTWAMLCRDAWALPLSAVVASFLAQTHVGFVAIALPLLVVGAAWLVVSVHRSTEPERAVDRRSLRRSTTLTVGLLLVVWAPIAADVVLNAPSNARRVVEWFRHGEDGVHTLGDGWGVVTGQFAMPPEWLTTKRPASFSGESPFLVSPPSPVLLIPVLVAAALLWRRRPDGRSLVVVLASTIAIGTVAVARTVGPVLDYRLRWTWIPPLLAFVVVAWAAWLVVVERWGRRADRVLTGAATVGLVGLTAVNVVTAATAGTPHADDSAMVAALVPEVVEHLDADSGPVVVSDPWTPGSWYGRALVLQLEKRGFDARVDPETAIEFTPHHAYSGPVQARFLVLGDDGSEAVANLPDVRLIARSVSRRGREVAQQEDEINQILADAAENGLSPEAALEAAARIELPAPPDGQMFAGSLAVYLDERPAGTGSMTTPR